jgi:ribosome biogenesis GTPase / thiamine phosphate phosphatase
MKSTGSNYVVRLPDGKCVNAKLRGRIRTFGLRTTNPVAAGDRVSIERDKNDEFVITDIRDRENYIVRKSVNLSKEAHIIAANLDRAFLVCTLNQPRTSIGFINRFLATAEAYHIPVVLVFNKVDLYTDEDRDYRDFLKMVYEDMDYLCLSVSAISGEGCDELYDMMADGVSLVSGHSGVGKSSLINRINPGLDLRTGSISDYHQKGKHTTTFAEMFELNNGGFIIDTPGIKGFGLVDIPRDELRLYFRDMFALQGECKYSGCLHLNEPGCAVTEAVEEGRIAGFRYADYLSMLEDYESGPYRSGRG